MVLHALYRLWQSIKRSRKQIVLIQIDTLRKMFRELKMSVLFKNKMPPFSLTRASCSCTRRFSSQSLSGPSHPSLLLATNCISYLLGNAPISLFDSCIWCFSPFTVSSPQTNQASLNFFTPSPFQTTSFSPLPQVSRERNLHLSLPSLFPFLS